MSKPDSGLFKGTKGAKNASIDAEPKKKKIPPLFRNGGITYSGISAHREKFMGKNVGQIMKLLRKQGYVVSLKPSKRKNQGSKAKIIVIHNPSKQRNITQVQVSPGSKRHGGVPYVKISTSNKGRLKIINGTRKDYKSDGEENARLYFRRRHKQK